MDKKIKTMRIVLIWCWSGCMTHLQLPHVHLTSAASPAKDYSIAFHSSLEFNWCSCAAVNSTVNVVTCSQRSLSAFPGTPTPTATLQCLCHVKDRNWIQVCQNHMHHLIHLKFSWTILCLHHHNWFACVLWHSQDQLHFFVGVGWWIRSLWYPP